MSPTSTYMRIQPRLQRFRSATYFLTLSSTLKTKHSLKAITEPILRAFRLPAGDHAEFPRGKPAILHWALTLIQHYASQSEESDTYRRRMGTLTLKELRWYKGSTGIEHEYVVAIIADPQYGLDRFIKLERARDDPGEELITFPTDRSLRRYAHSDDSISSSDSSSESYYEHTTGGCLDAVRLLHELPETDRLIERSTFRPSQPGYHAPTLLDLALAAKAVHDNNNYHLWSRQCVWFSTMIVRVMQSDFRHQITHRDSSLTFQNWMIEVLEEGIGTFKARSIYKEQEQITNDIVVTFLNSRAEVMERIEDAAHRVTRQKDQHQIIDEAVAQRDEAAAIAAEAAASSVEATARAAEAAARAADAEARAEREAELRAEAERRARDEARKNAMSEREVKELRRRIAEFEASNHGRGRSWAR